MITVTQEQLEKRGDEAPDEVSDAVFSDENNQLLAGIGKANNLSEKQEWDLARICLYAFLGFISTKDVFEELKTLFGGNTKAAYDAYVQIDQKLFEPVRAQIHEMRRKGESESVSAQAMVDKEKLELERRVDLRMQAKPGDVNLRRESVLAEAMVEEGGAAGPKPVMLGTNEMPHDQFSMPNQAQISNEVRNSNTFTQQQIVTPPTPPRPNVPIPYGQAVSRGERQLFSPHNFHMRVQAPEVGNQMPEAGSQKPDAYPPAGYPDPNSRTPMYDSGPIILHSKEEAVPIAETKKYGEYKNMSAGGFLGSFGNMFGRKKEENKQVPRADVQIPQISDRWSGLPAGGSDQERTEEGENVPMKVKKF